MKYSDEKDKCLGVVGMAIGLNIWDAEDMFSEINIDKQGFDCIIFTPSYYFSSTQSVSPKASWQHQLKIFKITMGLTLSNVVCRAVVGNNKRVDKNRITELLEIFIEQGKSELDLTNDECNTIFNKSFSYLNQLFANSRVQDMVIDFAENLKEKRKMNSCEVADYLALLNN